MGIAKRLNWQNIFIFLFLILFPFGQIIRLSFPFFGIEIPVQPIDIVVGLAAIYSVFRRLPKPSIFKYFTNFLLVAAFSFILSIFIFKTTTLVYGLFYLLRFAGYIYFLIYVWNFVRKNIENRNLVLKSLLGVSVMSAIFGWIQFFMIPDIKALFVYGWDMHLFRLVGTFLDPTFLGLIIVFGLLLSIDRCIDSWNWKSISIAIFLFISLAFTYSRASYLAFAAGVLVLGAFKNKLKWMLGLILTLIVIAFLLPTSRNHSIELLRSFSAIARIDNYKETIQIAKKFPVLGVGFNNLCLARNKYIAIESFSSHSCSGSDSSLLLILATTGVIGLILFVSLVMDISKFLVKSPNIGILAASGIALGVHSLFSNSLFYPWITGFVIILLAVSVKE